MKHQIHVGAGVMDPDYTGEVKILLFNAGIQKKVDKLPPTNKGKKGCGSYSVNIFHKP